MRSDIKDRGKELDENDLQKVVRNIRLHEKNSKKFIQLIASENSMSEFTRRFLNSDFAFRYALGRQNERLEEVGGWYFPNNRKIDEIENIADRVAKKLLDSNFNDFRPISGTTCFASVIFSFLDRGDRMMKISYENGGHSATEKIARKTGVEVSFLVYDDETLTIDVERSAKEIERVKPKMLMLDGSKILFPHPLKELSKVIPEDVIISYDASHVLGLICGGKFQNPLKEGAHILHGSTHKSFPGPQKGIISTRNERIHEKINTAVSYVISSHHLNSMVALTITLLEMERFGKEYAKQIISNAKQFAQSLDEMGFEVLGRDVGFTKTHQVMFDVSKFADALEAARSLEKAGILVNKCLIPFWNKPGIRIGVQEMTRFGMKKSEMKEIAEFMKRVIIKKENPRKIAADVKELRSNFTKTKYCFEV